VILMPTSLKENNTGTNIAGLTVLCGNIENIDYKPLVPFDSIVIEFFSAVSQDLMKTRDSKIYPDVMTFAFFCRKGNLSKLAETYKGRIENRVGRGLLFHIAPSNVPINFAYSLISGLLAGNANIVKASSKDFIQTRMVCQAFKRILDQEQFEKLKPFINVVMYDRSRQALTEYFSSICNCRVIWGGDKTIEAIRGVIIPPRTFDITFADRYSLAVISSDAVLRIESNEKAQKTLAQNFYNDTYLFDQNACSSPHLIYWIGDDKSIRKAQNIFWSAVYEYVKERYQVEAEIAVDKVLAAERTALAIKGSKLVDTPDNRIVRIDIPKLIREIPDLREAGGFFQEYKDKDLKALVPIVDEKYQTLAYYGLNPEKIRSFVIFNGLPGIDKIVPFGHTADWMFDWDGYDLITTMSRIVVTM